MPWARPSQPRFQDCVNTLILFICYLSQGKANPQWILKALSCILAMFDHWRNRHRVNSVAGYQQLELQISSPCSKLLAKGVWEETVVGNFNNDSIWGIKITKQESLLSHILGTKEINKFPVLVIKNHVKKHLTIVGEIPFSLMQM